MFFDCNIARAPPMHSFATGGTREAIHLSIPISVRRADTRTVADARLSARNFSNFNALTLARILR